MKSLLLSLTAFSLVATSAAAQEARTTPDAKPKTITVAGSVSDDRSMILSGDADSWTVANPSSLVGHEGHQVLLKVRISQDQKIHILTIKDETPMSLANKADSAFRR